MTTPRTPDAPQRDTAADLAAARVRRHLETSTGHIDLAPAPVAQLRERAARRTARRQRATAIGLVAAASFGVVGGIAVLSRSAPTRVITSSEPGGTETLDHGSDSVVPGTDPGVAPVGTEAIVSSGPPPTFVTGAGVDVDLFGDLGMAQQTDPAFVWKVVDPGKQASISSAFGSGINSSFPAFALSTAPGRSNDYDNIETFLYRSEDGISWTRTTAQTPFAAGYWNALVSSDQVFVTGTAPGIAKTQPNPLQIAVGTGDEWTIAELPVDTNAAGALPMISVSGPQVSSVPYGDGVLVVVTEQAYPDYGDINTALGIAPNEMQIIDQQADGVALAATDCLDAAQGSYDASYELFGPTDGLEIVPPTTILGPFVNGADFYGCPTTMKTWAEIGMPTESIAALSTSMSRFFIVDATLDIAEIDGPGEGGYIAVSADEPVVELMALCCSQSAPPRYELVDGTWTEIESTVQSALSRQGVELSDLRGRRVGLFGSQSDGRVPFMSIADDGTATGVDLQALFISDSSSWIEYSAATETHWVGAVQTMVDPIAAAGGRDLAFGDVIVRQRNQNGGFELLDAASGEPIDRAMVTGDDRGNIEVVRADGEVRANFHVEDVYAGMVDADQQQSAPTQAIVTTADGTSFAVESVPALLGLTDADVSRVARIASDGTTVIVTVTLSERYPDDTRKQLVLVGTPIG